MAQFENVDSRGPGKPYSARAVENAEVAEAGPALTAMKEELEMIDQLLGGTTSMRAAKRDRLPQHEYEPNKAYDRRVAQTYLDNYVLRTLNTLVGKAFKEPPSPGPDMDENLVTFLDDVDGQGTNLIPYARAYFRAGVKDAVSYTLVDAPARVEGSTLADDRMGPGPTWRHIPAIDMLDFQEGPTPIGVRPTLIRFRDDVVEADGLFSSKLVRRIKVITGQLWELWTLQTGPRGGKPKWVKTEEGLLDLGFVPCVPFYTDKTGPGEGRSSIADLAHLNVRHWQSTSDQINILTVCRFPILAASGIREGEGGDSEGPGIVIGPNKFITTPDPQSKVYWVEHTGAALQSGADELGRLEQAMASYGAEFLKKGAQGPESASGRVLDAGDAISPLQSWGLDFRDCLHLLLTYTAEMMGSKDAKIDVQFEIEPDVDMADGSELTSLDQARTRRDISRKAHLGELQRRGILAEEYDMDEDWDEITSEPPPPGMGLDGMGTGMTGAKLAPKPPEPVAPSSGGVDVASAKAALKAAVARHERHMAGTEPTSNASQMKMMDEMKVALSALSGGGSSIGMKM